MVDSPVVGTEPGVESQVVDLGALPLSMLRVIDGAALRRSLLHVAAQARYARISSEHGLLQAE